MKILKKIIFNFINKNRNQKSSIVLYIQSKSSASIMAIMAQKLIAKGESVYFLVDEDIDSFCEKIEDFVPDYRSRWFSIQSFSSQSTSEKEKQFISKKIHLFEKIYPSNMNKGLYEILIEQTFIAQKTIQALYKNFNIALLLVPEDGLGGNHVLIKEFQDKQIPVMIVPYGFGSEKDYEDSIIQKHRCNTAVNTTTIEAAIVKDKFPKWVKQGNCAGNLFLEPCMILVREFFGYSPHNPWTVHGGSADYLLVESNKMMQHYLKEQLPPSKLIFCGTVYMDVIRKIIFENIDYQMAYEQSKKIEEGKTRILISWLPSYHEERGYLCEIPDYETLTTKVFNLLSSLPHTKITLSFHPAVIKQFDSLSEFQNIQVSNEYILTEIPKHDVFICCNSSTLRWATASAKPVVNYNFYHFSTDDYNDIPGLVSVTKFEDFKRIISQLITDEYYYHSVAKAQKKVSSDWGIIEKDNFENIYGYLKSVTYQANNLENKTC